MATEPTNFSGLASAGNGADAYANTQTTEDATKIGGYERNTDGIKKLTLILYPFQRKPPKSLWFK